MQNKNKKNTRPVLVLVSLLAIFLFLVSSVDAKGIPCSKDYPDDGYSLRGNYGSWCLRISVPTGEHAAFVFLNEDAKEKFIQNAIEFTSGTSMEFTPEEIRQQAEEAYGKNIDYFRENRDKPVEIQFT